RRRRRSSVRLLRHSHGGRLESTRKQGPVPAPPDDVSVADCTLHHEARTPGAIEAIADFDDRAAFQAYAFLRLAPSPSAASPRSSTSIPGPRRAGPTTTCAPWAWNPCTCP